MPITALPADNTDRWYYDYSVGGFQHTLVIRSDGSSVSSEVEAALNLLLGELSTYLAEITTVGLRHSNAGSSITNPVATTILSATFGTGAQGAIDAPIQTTFTGRSSDGHKARVGIFGAAALTDATYRIATTENAEIAAFIDDLITLSAAGLFVSISAQRVTWHSYANVGLNDHFVKKMRG